MRVQFRVFGCGHPVLPTLFAEDRWEFLKVSKLTSSSLHIHLLISNLTLWEYAKIKPGSSQGLLHTKCCPWKNSRDQLKINVLKNKVHRETQHQEVKDKTTQLDEAVTMKIMKIMTSITSGSQIKTTSVFIAKVVGPQCVCTECSLQFTRGPAA